MLESPAAGLTLGRTRGLPECAGTHQVIEVTSRQHLLGQRVSQPKQELALIDLDHGLPVDGGERGSVLTSQAGDRPRGVDMESPSGEGRLVGLAQLVRNSPYGQP